MTPHLLTQLLNCKSTEFCHVSTLEPRVDLSDGVESVPSGVRQRVDTSEKELQPCEFNSSVSSAICSFTYEHTHVHSSIRIKPITWRYPRLTF
jgi:hypothetical protein